MTYLRIIKCLEPEANRNFNPIFFVTEFVLISHTTKSYYSHIPFSNIFLTPSRTFLKWISVVECSRCSGFMTHTLATSLSGFTISGWTVQYGLLLILHISFCLGRRLPSSFLSLGLLQHQLGTTLSGIPVQIGVNTSGRHLQQKRSRHSWMNAAASCPLDEQFRERSCQGFACRSTLNTLILAFTTFLSHSPYIYNSCSLGSPFK